MHVLLDHLLREHRDLEKLIAILERQRVALDRGHDPDFPLMQSVLHYLGNYPDLVHHPREDLLYDRLILRRPELAADIASIIDQHYVLESMTRRFAALVDRRLGQGVMTHPVDVPGDGLEALAREYTELYRHHIMVEEKELFPRALEVLDGADWESIADAVELEIDPLFGGDVAAQYHMLHHEIMRTGA